MKTVYHSAASRGHADYGWLNTHYSFSFADYYNHERVHYGALRVLNDDSIAPASGFSTHPHDNMEIITIPLKGAVEHKDSMNNHGLISAGEIQVMSAGTGVFHSEFNGSKTEQLELLQIWILTNQRNVKPRYDQLSLDDLMKKDEFFQILSPNPDDQGVWIYQNAWFHLGQLSEGWQGGYQLKDPKNGVYCFVIEGDITVASHSLTKRDALGVSEVDSIDFLANTAATVLLMEVPI